MARRKHNHPTTIAHAGCVIMGFDFWATITVEIWSDPTPATWTDPGDPAEFFATSIILQRDEPDNIGPGWEIEPGTRMFEHLEHLFENQMSEAAYEDAAERDYMRRYATRGRDRYDD
jgi:hypothetical protein